jgi:hypothetical protein
VLIGVSVLTDDKQKDTQQVIKLNNTGARINLSNYENGFYIIHIITQHKTFNLKIIKGTSINYFLSK